MRLLELVDWPLHSLACGNKACAELDISTCTPQKRAPGQRLLKRSRATATPTYAGPPVPPQVIQARHQSYCKGTLWPREKLRLLSHIVLWLPSTAHGKGLVPHKRNKRLHNHKFISTLLKTAVLFNSTKSTRRCHNMTRCEKNERE